MKRSFKNKGATKERSEDMKRYDGNNESININGEKFDTKQDQAMK